VKIFSSIDLETIISILNTKSVKANPMKRICLICISLFFFIFFSSLKLFSQDSLDFDKELEEIEILFNLEKYDECQKIIDKVTSSSFDKDNSKYAYIYYYKGLVLDKKNRVPESMKYLNNALELSAGEDSLLLLTSDIKDRIGFLLYESYEAEKSLKYLRESLNIRKKILDPNNVKIANSHYHIALNYVNEESTSDKVIANVDSAIYIYSKLKSPTTEFVRSIMIKGIAYQGLDDLKKAKKYFQKALELSKKIPEDKKVVINIYLNLGNNYHKVEDESNALKYYNQALQLSLEINGPDHHKTLDVLSNISLTKSSLKQFDEAIEINKKVLKSMIKKYGEDDIDVASAYNSIGVTYSIMKNDIDAIKYYQKAEAIYVKVLPPTSIRLAINYFNLGESYHNAKAFEEAILSYDKSLEIVKKSFGPNHIINAACHYYKAATYTELKEFKKANNLLEKTKKKLGYDKNDLSKLKSYSKGADLFFSLGSNYSGWFEDTRNTNYLYLAQENYDIGLNLLDVARNDFESKSSGDFLMNKYRADFENVLTNLYRLNTIDSNNYANKMFAILDGVKNKQLNDGVTHNNAIRYSSIPDSILEKDNLFAERSFMLKHEIKMLKSFGNDSLELFTLKENLLTENEDEYLKYLSILENDYPSYFQLMHDNIKIDIELVQSKILDHDEALIDYFIEREYIFSFTITKSGFYIDSVKIDEVFKNDLSDYIKSLKVLGNNNFIDKSNDLYKKLLAKTINQLSNNINSLIIIPDGILGYLPFESFVVYKENTVYLNEKFDIRYGYSARLLFNQKKKRKSNSELLAAFAPKYDYYTKLPEDSISDYMVLALVRSGNYSLPGSQKEVSNISDLISTKKFIGEEATEENFKNQANKYKILHLSMHALVDELNPLDSKLVFANKKSSIEDGFLHAFELYSMNINADLAVLSACKTGVGKFKNGEGIMSLSRAFTFAGVPATVMSLWKVPDEATSEIMSNFYHNLKNGLSKSVSLNKAKKQYLKNTVVSSMKHPFYWSGFVLVGDNNPVVINTFNDLWILFWGILIILIVFFIFNKAIKPKVNNNK